MCWLRASQSNVLRSTLREFYPAALLALEDLTHSDALAVLEIAPDPVAGARLSKPKIASALRRGGRQRGVETRAEAIWAALGSEQLHQPPLVADAFAASVSGLVNVLAATAAAVTELEGQLEAFFGRHPAAELILSQPGLGNVLGARVLAEFGDDPSRYADVKAGRNYAGTSPITRASGRSHLVMARFACNKRLRNAVRLQAFAALQASPGARAYYQRQRARGATNEQALRALANRLVGILHGCLRHNTHYDEARAWPVQPANATHAA
jgi:hypothetical protein